jgi:hypothetical protein
LRVGSIMARTRGILARSGESRVSRGMRGIDDVVRGGAIDDFLRVVASLVPVLLVVIGVAGHLSIAE